MNPTRPVTPTSPLEDQIRYLDDFLHEGEAGPTLVPDAAHVRRQALQRIRTLLAEVHQQVAAQPDF